MGGKGCYNFSIIHGKTSAKKSRRSVMREKIRGVLWFLVLALFLYGTAAEAETNTPKATVQSLLDSVKNLSEAKNKEAEAQEARRISEGFDLTGICKACLRATWDRLSREERKSFVSLFREVLEKVAYPKSADFFKGTEIEVENVTQEVSKAQVETVVIHPEEGMVEVCYRLEPVNGKWLIQDLELDGVSLLLDLRSQMQKIIREKSYDELKKRFREKIDSDT